MIDNSIQSIAIGSFDGIHLAHQNLISRVEAIIVIERNSGVLTAGYRRTRFIDKPIYFYHFDNISSLLASEFINMIVLDFPNLKKIVVGYDFAFGYKKEGDCLSLQKLFHSKVEVIDEIFYNDISIHSKKIKKYLKDANIKIVNRLLGREYECEGIVIKGQGIGAKEIMATINLKFSNYILPKNGVYATKTLINNQYLPSITFIGHRVSSDGKFAVETHIIDKNITYNSKKCTIKWLDFIRDNKKFNSLSDLKDQIKKDIEIAKDLTDER